MSLYTMKLSDSVDTMEFNLLEVPIQDKDIEGAVDNVVLSGDIYTDFLWLKKRFTHKWSILCKDDYERLRGFYTRQFSNAEVPIYQLLDAPSPVEESAGSGEYIQITTTDSTAKLASVEMLGNAEQTTYSGKNLCNFNVAQPSGVTYNSDGTITINRAGGFNINIANINIQANEAYTTSYELISGTITGADHILMGLNNAGWINSQPTGYITNTFSSSTTTNTLYTGGNNTYNNARIRVQIEKSSVKTAYEPYVGGTPAPNPEFPMPISVVTGENTVKIEGKNLFDLQASTRTDAGVVFTKTTDTITAIGTTTRGAYAETLSIYDNFSSLGNYPAYATTTATNSFQLPAGTYTFSANITNTGNTTGGLNIGVGTLGARVSTSTKLEKTAGQSGTALATINVAEGQYVLLSVWYEGTANTSNVNLSINQIQLEKGSSASQFEPYQAQEFEVNLGKNLFDANYYATATYTSGTYKYTTTDFVGGKTYTFSATLKAGKTAISGAYICISDNTNPNTTNNRMMAVYSGTPTATGITASFASNATIYFQFYPTTLDIEQIFDTYDFQLEEGSVRTPYEPFVPYRYELAKIGDYQDRIYKTSGKWYIEKQVGKVVLDGTEDGWGWADTARYTIATANIGAREAISDHFTYVNYTGHASTASPSFDISSNLASIGFHDKDITSLNNFKTWLASNPTTVYYALATPTTTEITNETLIAQLDALGASSLYLGVNNIGTETLNAVPTLALTYFPYYPHEIISPKAVRMELTDGGIINACECRENVQITLRETIQ